MSGNTWIMKHRGLRRFHLIEFKLSLFPSCFTKYTPTNEHTLTYTWSAKGSSYKLLTFPLSPSKGWLTWWFHSLTREEKALYTSHSAASSRGWTSYCLVYTPTNKQTNYSIQVVFHVLINRVIIIVVVMIIVIFVNVIIIIVIIIVVVIIISSVANESPIVQGLSTCPNI